MRSRNLIPLGFVALHWVLIAAALIWRGHSYPFHLAYEPLLLQFILVADLPALLVLLAVGIEIKLSLADNTWWEVSLAVIGISLQWAALGLLVSRSRHHRKGLTALE